MPDALGWATYNDACNECGARHAIEFGDVAGSWARMEAAGWTWQRSATDQHDWWWLCPSCSTPRLPIMEAANG